MSTDDHHTGLPFVFVDYASNPIDVLAKDIISLDKPSPSDLSGFTIWCESRSVIHTIKLKLLTAAKTAGIKSLLFPNIITLQDWVWQQDTPNQPLISESNKQLLLVEAIRQSPGLFQTNNAWPLAKELINLFNECTLAQVPLKNGEQALRNILLKSYQSPVGDVENISRESEIVYTLWNAYREQIQARNWVDPIDHYCQYLAQHHDIDQKQQYYLVGKHRFHTAEVLFLHALSKEYALSIYSTTISSTQYGIQNHPSLKLISSNPKATFTDTSRSCALNLIYDQSNHIHERIKLFKDKLPENIFNSWLSIYTCGSVERHVNAVCLQAKKWLLENKHPIGIVVNDRLLARRIRAVLEEEGITPSDLGGWTLSTTSAATSIEVLLDAVEKNFKKESLLDLLSSPFLPNNSDENPAYQRELHQTKKNLKQHRNTPTDNLDTFINLISKSFNDEIEYDEIISICNSLKELTAPIQKYHARGDYELFEFSNSLLTLLKSLGIQECLQNDDAGRQLLDTLNTNILSVRSNSIKINWKEWRQWLRDIFENNYFIPETTDDRITLCGFEHIDDFNFTSAIIAGIEENRLTSTTTHRTFFNEKVRHELTLPTSHEAIAINFVRFRQLLEQCDQILLSAEIEKHGEPQELCAWVKLIKLFSDLAFSISLDNTELDPLIKQRYEFEACKTVHYQDKTTCPRPNVDKELVPSRISATQYQSLIDCPYQYFAKYVLDLREQEETDEFEASDFGKLVHQSLYEFHFNDENKSGTAFTTSQRTNLIDSLIETSTLTFMRAVYPNTVKEAWLQRWLTNIPSYIDWAIERNQKWKTLRGECTLDNKLSETTSLYGQIDRIDSDTKNYAVIDYKTGSVTPSKKSVLNGETVQLPFYALLDKKINQAEYLSLGSQDKTKPVAVINAEELEYLKSEHLNRLEELLNDLKNGAFLPAHGDDFICNVCNYEGLCRKSHWTEI